MNMSAAIMESEKNPNKRKRETEKDPKKALLFWCLPAVGCLSGVLRFLSPTDRLPLAVTCSTGLQFVEDYSKSVVELIRRHHHVDTTFEFQAITI